MEDRNRSGRWSTGFIGAFLGAVFGASFVYFSNPDNRAKVKERVKTVEGDAQVKLAELKDSVGKASLTSKKRMAGNLRKFADQLEA